MPQVLAAFPDCELILIGGGAGVHGSLDYEDDIAGAGVGKVVRIIPRVPKTDLPSWICASDTVALPSIREGFGLIAAEALACGRPVVATRSGGPEDIVDDGQGFLVPPRDADTLSSALISALGRTGIDDPGKIAESARLRFSPEIVAKKIIDVYRKIDIGYLS